MTTDNGRRKIENHSLGSKSNRKTDDTPPYWASKPNKLTSKRKRNSRPNEPFLNQDVPIESLHPPFLEHKICKAKQAGLLARPTQPLKKFTFSIVARVL